MKLFSLPYLAYSQIITSMNPIEVICLSFCSKQSRERIKQIRFHVYYAVISTEIVEPKSPTLQLQFSPSSRYILIPFQLAPRWARCEGRRFTGIIDGVKHYFRSTDDEDDGTILYSDIKKCGFQISNYILDLVQGKLEKLRMDLHLIDDWKGFVAEPCLNSLSRIEILSKTVSSEKLSALFNNIENPRHVHIHYKVEGRVDPNSIIFRSDMLIIYETSWITREHLLGFNGKYLCFINPIFGIESIIEFIKQWKNGNNTKFAILKMAEVPQEFMNRDRFISEFDAKPWDPTKREKCYIYDKEITQDIVADLSEGLDFERDDGLLATIKIRPSRNVRRHRFQFFVWHKRFTTSE
ncbi:hypothetical protein CRE_08231 [Caenorhabditis remanei]|uniref:F-box domain-containing protein n=1 Tax=Caenorhabditis remanei TaxID=31234 RepID=E3M365_CAERE|nr:hypothetical protein CRE_08231 [Caenorhabditis remanei]